MSKDIYNQPTYERIRNSIRERIISGEIEAGGRLTIQELTSYYQVSQMPIREALQWLQGEGLLKIVPHRGAIIRAINPQMIRNDYDIRGAIEHMLIKKSFQYISRREIAFLETKHEELCAAISSYKIGEILAKDREMHLSIYEHADNPEAVSIYDRYSEFLGALRGKYGIGEDRLKEIVTQHEEIIRAFREKDIAALEMIVMLHNEHAKRDLLLQMGMSD